MPSAATPSVLVVGSINADLVLRAPRLPRPGESVLGTQYCRVAGGKGANQAVAVARLGAAATFVGRTGRDADGEMLISQLKVEGVYTEFVSCSDKSSTGLAVITIDDSGRNSIVVMPGANEEVSGDDVAAVLRVGKFSGILLQLEIPPKTVTAACRLAHERSLPVVLDAGPAQGFDLEALPGLHVLTPNETETHALTGIMPDSTEDAKRAAEILLRRSSAKAVVIKLGERGALLCERAGPCEHVPAFRVDAVDSTAAGDAFTAAMTIELLRSGDLRRAVKYGNAAGALAASKLGAQPSIPTRVELQRFCEAAGQAL